jgi:site-specific recombinase XerD
MNHLNPTLSATQKWMNNETVKARLKLRIVASMTSGGYHNKWAKTPIIVRVGDIEKVHSYAREHASPRDFLLLHLPYAEGLRTGEIATLDAGHIDFEHGTFYVFDSKQKTLCSYPIPLDMVTLQLLEDLLAGRTEGYVFTRARSWKYAKANEPLSIQEVWHVIRKLGLEAGVEGLKPRHLREHFAYNWACVEEKNLVTLQLILRHESLETTQIYIHKMYPWEKMREDFDAKRNSPFVTNQGRSVSEVCKDCVSVNVCKYAPLPDCVEGCRLRQQKKEELKRW